MNSGSGNRPLGLTAIRRGFELYECLLVLLLQTVMQTTQCYLHGDVCAAVLYMQIPRYVAEAIVCVSSCASLLAEIYTIRFQGISRYARNQVQFLLCVS